MKSMLVICEGNICRSPMAEGLLSTALSGVHVRSAGLHALIGMPADQTAIRLMSERGVDISMHRAIQVTRKLCLDADLILTMNQKQRQRIQALYPETYGRVFGLGEHSQHDIPDPYGHPERVFREALFFIDRGIAEWLRRIKRLSSSIL